MGSKPQVSWMGNKKRVDYSYLIVFVWFEDLRKTSKRARRVNEKKPWGLKSLFKYRWFMGIIDELVSHG